MKNRRSLLTFVSGCILPSDREKFLDRFDLLFSINELPQLPDMISQYGVSTPFSGGSFTGGSPDQRVAAPEAVGNKRPAGPMWLKDPKPNPVLKLLESDSVAAKNEAAEKSAKTPWRQSGPCRPESAITAEETESASRFCR
jgi:hypothetical protein